MDQNSNLPTSDAGVCHLKQKALARRWDLSTRTLERWRRTGSGPVFLKLNGRVIYRLKDVEAFEQARARASTGSPSKPNSHTQAWR